MPTARRLHNKPTRPFAHNISLAEPLESRRLFNALNINVSGGAPRADGLSHPGGNGGSIIMVAGEHIDTGDGARGILSTSLAAPLTTGEYDFIEVATPDFSSPLELQIDGNVTIRTQFVFSPTRIVGIFHPGQPAPHLTVYAGQQIQLFDPDPSTGEQKEPTNYAAWHLYQGARSTRVDFSPTITQDDGSGMDGATFEFHTSDKTVVAGDGGNIPVYDASGASGVVGGKGGKGGTIRMINVGTYNAFLNASGGNGGAGVDGYDPVVANGRDGTPGGDGGDGGTIMVRNSLQSFARVYAAGGVGGKGGYGMYGVSGSGTGASRNGQNGHNGAAGGNGGAGGVVVTDQAFTPKYSTDFSAAGGRGGDGGSGGAGGSASSSGGNGGNGGFAGAGGAGGAAGRSSNITGVSVLPGAGGSGAAGGNGGTIPGGGGIRGAGGAGGNGGNAGGPGAAGGTAGAGGTGSTNGKSGTPGGVANFPRRPLPDANTWAAPPATKWTVMIYAGADCDAEGAVLDLLSQFESVNLGAAPVSVVVELDRTDGADDRPLPSAYGVDWKYTRRGFLTYSPNTLSLTHQSHSALMPIGDENMGDPDTLRYFIKWAKDAAPAEHYALVVLGHGAGYPGNAIDFHSSAPYNALSPVDYRDALADPAAKLDIVGFDTCVSQLIDYAAALQGRADYLFGSPGEIPLTSWFANFGAWLESLESGPTPAAAARSLYDTAPVPPWAWLSVIDVNAMGNALPGLRALVSAALSSNTTAAQHKRIWEAAGGATGSTYSDPSYRDLGQFLANLAADATLAGPIHDAATAALAAYNAAVLAHYGTTGMGAYLPAGGLRANDYYAIHAEPFAAPQSATNPFGCDWQDFLANFAPNKFPTVPNPGATLTTASPLILINGQAGVSGSLSAVGQTHVYSIQATAGQMLAIDQSNTLLNTYQVYGPDKQPLSPLSYAGGDTSKPLYRAATTGTYYTAVTARNLLFGQFAPYRLFFNTASQLWVEPQLVVGTPAVNAGTLTAKRQSIASIHLSNTGLDTLTINSLTLPAGTRLNLDGSLIPFPLQIDPGDAIDLPITIDPDAPGSVTGQVVTLSTNDRLNPTVTVPVSYTAVNAPTPTVTVDTPAGTQIGNVVINYHLLGGQGDRYPIIGAYSLDNGANWYYATPAAASPPNGVASPTGNGALNTFIWNSANDLPGASRSDVLFAAIVLDDAGNTHFSATGPLTILNPTGIALSPSARVTLSGPANGQTLTVSAGSVTFSRDLSLTFPGVRVSVTGSATAVTLSSAQHLAALTIGDGATARVATTSPVTLDITTLSLSAAATLDLAGNSLTTATSAATLRDYARRARGPGADWSQPGLTTDLAIRYPALYSIGFATANGQTLARATSPADANLDGSVDFNDLVALAQNYNTTNKSFAQGDFNYDGTVDFNDLVLLAQRYNTTLTSPAASLPVPASTSLPISAPAALPVPSKPKKSTPPVFATKPIFKPTKKPPAKTNHPK